MTSTTPATATTSRRDLLVGIATVLYLAGAFALLTADEPWTTRMAIVQTAALFGCGVLIVRRTTTPVIGWLLVVPGVTFNLIYAFEAGDLNLAAVGWVAWLTPLSTLGLLALALLLLVFPTGRLETRATRVLAGIAVVGHLTGMVGEFLAVAGLVDITFEAGFQFLTASFFVVVVGGLVEQVRRYRTRPRLEQQQLKWFLVAIAGQSVYVVMAVAGVQPGSLGFAVFDNLATMLWPITIVIAITRYRLYEIDRIVSRTVAYAAVIAALAVLGIGMVSVVTTLLPAQDRLVVAVTTVGVVVLFDPLRRRVVRAVDRRFDRAHYEAERVIEEFGRGVRGTTDLGAVRDQLEAVLARTVAPATVAVWEPAGGERSTPAG